MHNFQENFIFEAETALELIPLRIPVSTFLQSYPNLGPFSLRHKRLKRLSLVMRFRRLQVSAVQKGEKKSLQEYVRVGNSSIRFAPQMFLCRME